MTGDEADALRAEVGALAAEVAVMRSVVDLFYEAGRADALCLPPRVPPRRPGTHLSVVQP